jgi:putative DNA primase/helicase
MRDGTAIRSSVTSTIYQLKDPEGDAQRAKAAHERSLSGLNFDLAGEMGIDPEPASLPVTFNILNVIQLSTDLDADLKACEQALINSPVEIFQRGGFIVRRSFITGKSHDGSDVTDTHVARHTSETLRIALAEAAKFERYDERKKDMVRKHPPIEYAGLLLKHPDKHYPPLRGIVNTPVLRADGTLISVPGYDKATGLYFDPLGVEFGVIPLKPTRKQAEAALNDLKALFEKFPFVDEASRSVALARCLTPFVRPSLKCAPMFAATAPAARTGKSKLTDIASAITTGHEASVIGATETAEELDKQLSAILLSGATSITLDNLNANFSLKSSLLCQILTQEIVEIRPFGKNDELITVPSISVVSVNGNNLRVVDDLTERTLLCRLDANMELPGTRSFDFDPIEMVKDDRAKYVRACLTILRAYAVAGYPDNAKPVMGGFDDWSNRVRSALVWLGCDDPCATMQQLRDQDEGKGVLDELLGVWRREFGDDYWTIGHAIDHAKGTEIDGVWRKPVTDLLDALSGLCPANRLNPRLVSRWFGNVKGVVVNGRRFVSYQCKNSNDAKRWCVEVIDAPEPRF